MDIKRCPFLIAMPGEGKWVQFGLNLEADKKAEFKNKEKI